MPSIQLNKGIMLIDKRDWDFIKSKYRKPYVNGSGYARCNERGAGQYKSGATKSHAIHRLIMDCPHGMEVDHINRNRLDNRRCNLRICTVSENRKNSATPKHNTSGYRGVSPFKRDGNYEAYIRINGKKKRIGYFDCKIEASRAYDKEALKHYGEFAVINGV